ncbi:MAG: GlsB/YeaQ/YmgE family stress response membrane protein [Neomegalonema sp.]|nr:GlsB/YeaQ/YmgE family stress response membrane protein [Neomegalonema sp.]
MDLVQIIITLAIGACAGWLAAQIMSRRSLGVVGNIIVGVLGALVAGFLLPGILPLAGLVGQIVSATIGAVILLFVIGLVKKR